MRIRAGLRPKIKFFFVTIILCTITIILLIPPRRPRATLIFNNKYLCTSLPAASKQRSIVIMVLSHRRNFVRRNLIRNTWGSFKNINNIHISAVVFMLGSMDTPGEEVTDSRKLENEMLQFGDLIMGDFVENYRNLTLKSIMAYEWLTTYCQEAEIVVKTDDDVLLNIFKLTEELNAWNVTKVTSSHFECAVHYYENVIFELDRYRVLPEEFPGVVFPTHCAGVGYVVPMGVIVRIIDEISRSFLGCVCTHEDVFMTGILPEKINSMNSSIHEPITHVDRMVEWVTYALEDGHGDLAHFLMELVNQPANETGRIEEFKTRCQTQIFYLINHGIEFESRYQRLWQIIEKAFHNEAND